VSSAVRIIIARLWEWFKAIDSSDLGLPEWDRELRQLTATFRTKTGRIQVGVDADSEYRVFGWSLDWRGNVTPKTAVEAKFETPAEMLAWLNAQRATRYQTWLEGLKVDSHVVVVKQVDGKNIPVQYGVGAILKRSIRVGPWHFSKRTGGLLRLPGCTAWIEAPKTTSAHKGGS